MREKGVVVTPANAVTGLADTLKIHIFPQGFD